MKSFLLVLFTTFLSSLAYTQENDSLAISIDTAQQTKDTTTFLKALGKGKLSSSLRYFFMHTNNQNDLSDYNAHALGASLRYQTGSFKNLKVVAGIYGIANISSSNLTIPDQKTGQMNRYEIGLYQIPDSFNNKPFFGIDELLVKYVRKNFTAIAGMQYINTPFINQQDGRMKPTAVKGIWTELKNKNGTKINAGYFYKLSPRSTARWYSVANSIGIYPQGVNPDGSKSDYGGNLTSNGLFVFAAAHQINNVKLQLHELYAANIFNSLLLQADFSTPVTKKLKTIFGAQLIHQQAINNGGNANASKTYFTKSGHSLAFGGRAGLENEKWQSTFNYTRITAAGRYIVPREWGRDPFYTFMQRERNDGFGDMHAFLVKTTHNNKKAGLQYSIGIGYFKLPSVLNNRLNKYGLPSYYQLNTELRYSFKNFLKGLDALLLYVYKRNDGNVYNNDKYIINKVNMSNFNVVLNYNF